MDKEIFSSVISHDVADTIKSKVKEAAFNLMSHENKNECLIPGVLNWHYWITKEQELIVLVPSNMFVNLILRGQYISVANRYSHNFGTGSDWDILEAIKMYYSSTFPQDYTIKRFHDFLSRENFAYVFHFNKEMNAHPRILRLDLFRSIDPNTNLFRGGIFHALKHFTIDGYATLSHNKGEYSLGAMSDLLHVITCNFFSKAFLLESVGAKAYEAYSNQNGKNIRGIYYKEINVPVYFLNSIRVDS